MNLCNFMSDRINLIDYDSFPLPDKDDGCLFIFFNFILVQAEDFGWI